MEDKFVLNLDAPDTDGEEELADDMLLPAPDMVLPDYLDPHAAEIEQLTAFVRYLFPSYTIAGICGTDDKWRMQIWLETLAAEYLWMRDLRIAEGDYDTKPDYTGCNRQSVVATPTYVRARHGRSSRHKSGRRGSSE